MRIQLQTKESRNAKQKNVESYPEPRIQPVSRHPLLHLQQTIGNQILGQLIQAKLKISQPGDQYEQEADRVAEQVMRMPASAHLEGNSLLKPSVAAAPLQRSCAKCEEEDEEKTIQRQAADESDASEELKVQAKGRAGPAVQDSTATAGRINNLGNGGEPLPESTRAFFEPRFGYDFSGVRLHTDGGAADSAHALNAHAYTLGKDIVFGAGQYEPESVIGRRLLAHELAHVVQQSESSWASVPLVQRDAAPPAADGGLSPEMLAQIARQLHEAMAGLGTDETAIFAAMGGRTQDQINGIVRVYQEIYHRDLFSELRSELTDSEMQYLGAFAPRSDAGTSETPADLTRRSGTSAQQLYEAMDRLGTDESAIYAALSGRTTDERQAIKDAYRQIGHRHELEADLRDELSGAELVRALRLLNQGMLAPEDELYLAMEGLGTDEETIFRVLEAMAGDTTKITNLDAKYRSKYGDLVADLRSDLSAGEYQRARRVLVPTIPDADVQDCDSSANPLQQTNTVREAHALAFVMLTNAITRSSTPADPAVQAAASRHFKITVPPVTPEDRILWAHVQRALATMSRADSEVVYECEPEQSFWHGACSSGNIAVSLLNIHLCPLWWTAYPTVDQRAAILVHEWGHKFGAGVNRIFEEYCTSPEFAALAASTLVHLPDAYMGFAYDLYMGLAMPCL